MSFRKRPGIWFLIWSIDIIFWLGLLLARIDIDWKISALVFRMVTYVCLWWIFYFHINWLMEIDEKQYKKQKLKDEWEKQKWVL
jgi:hypothetical protein